MKKLLFTLFISLIICIPTILLSGCTETRTDNFAKENDNYVQDNYIPISTSTRTITQTKTTKNGETTITYSSSSENAAPITKSGEISGIYSNSIIVPNGKNLISRGIISGDVEIEKNANFTNYGTISGDIKNNGTVTIYGTASGDISNHGRLEIYGTITGEIFTNNNIYISPDAHIIGKIEKF